MDMTQWLNTIWRQAAGLTWDFEIWDVVDIAVMAYIFYQVLMFIRRSRSGQVAKAILLLFVALGLSSICHLDSINFILSRTLELGLIALLIIFQPELRRLLEQMGSGSLKNSFIREERGNEMENAIVQTVAAYASLSRDKVGALMVFERKTMLDDVIKTGTELDARVSAELLKNLFWNKAPLHDGAVILREGRIVGGGCMLPLSGNVNLSKDLGMRHRAGIGISENSDAVVAIVSEETGSISVAVSGMLKRHLSPDTLRRLLRNELAPDLEEKKPTAAERITSVFRRRRGDKTNGKEDPRQ